MENLENELLDYFDGSSKVVRVESFHFETEAQFYRVRFEAEGIRCFLTNTNTTTILSGYSIATGGVGLYVKETDVEVALDLIKEIKTNEKTRLDEDFRDADQAEIAYQKALHESKSRFGNMVFIVVAVLVIALLLFMKISATYF